MSVARFKDYLPVVIGLAIIMVWSVIFLLLPYRQHLRLSQKLKQHGILRIDHRTHLGQWLTCWRSERTYHLGKPPSPDLEQKLAAQLQRWKMLRIRHRFTGRIVVYNDQVQGNPNHVQAIDFSKAIIEVRIHQESPELRCLAIFEVVARRVVWVSLAFTIGGLLLILFAGSDVSWHDLRHFYAMYLVIVLGYFWFIRIVAQFLATGNFFDALLAEALTVASVDSATPGPL